MDEHSTTPPDKLLLSIPEAARQLSIGRTLLYDLIARREVRPVYIGSRTLIPRATLDEYVARLSAAS